MTDSASARRPSRSVRNFDGGLAALQFFFEQQPALSTRGKVCTVEGANHVSPVDRQEYADRTWGAIMDMVAAARGG